MGSHGCKYGGERARITKEWTAKHQANARHIIEEAVVCHFQQSVFQSVLKASKRKAEPLAIGMVVYVEPACRFRRVLPLNAATEVDLRDICILDIGALKKAARNKLEFSQESPRLT